MKKDVIHLLEFPKSNKVFNKMGEDSLDILMNIEIIFKNFLNLQKYYHEPDNFIIECNNIIRNLVFLIEKGKNSKTKYLWLYEYINEFQKDYLEEKIILKKIRDNSMHQELLVSEGAIVFGLYKIMTDYNYKLKIGMGDIQKKRELSMNYIYSNTESFFQKILFFHYYMFMDLEHSAIGECLGITRYWIADIKYKDQDGKKKSKEIDIFELISKVSDILLNGIIKSYCKYKNISDTSLPLHIESKYNFVNTILEVDLYPKLFCKLWDREIKPLNWKYLLEDNLFEFKITRENAMNNIYSFIPDKENELISLLERYKNIKFSDFKDQQDYDKYISFILLPHYFITKFFDKDSILEFEIDELMKLQKLGELFVENFNYRIEEVEDNIIDEYISKMGKQIEIICQKYKDSKQMAI